MKEKKDNKNSNENITVLRNTATKGSNGKNLSVRLNGGVNKVILLRVATIMRVPVSIKINR